MPGDEEEIAPKTEIVSHVAVKPAPFYVKNPDMWFKRLESQFVLANVTNTVTKFHHVMAALPEDIGSNIETTSETYEALKDSVLNSLKANKHELIQQALSSMDLGYKRPSQLVSEIKRRFAEINIPVDDSIVKSRLLSAFPVHLKSALVGHDDASLESFAKIADSMIAVSQQVSPFVNAVQASSSDRNQGQFHGDKRSFQPFQRSQIRPFYPDQRPRICNAHIFYAEKARTCRHWCRWPGQRGKVLKNNEKTPHQSRSSSPSN